MKLKVLFFFALFANTILAQNYHDTQGKLDISAGGQANFTLPIALPPSISSIGPTINLAYTSGATTGLAGQGWNINSISSIARVSTRLDIEGYRDGVDFDADDKLSLDGQYLIIKSGDYWASGSVYQTEVQSNVKIELQGSGATMFFVVTAPDGAKSWYGNYNGQVATDQTAFYLTRYEDADGNIITYNYLTYINSLYISEIKFSANSNTNPTPLNRILFTYKQASRTESYYIKEIEIKKDRILDKIEVFTNNLLFKKYQLTHIADNNGYDRVSTVQEFNSNNEPANPISFEYNQTSYNPIEGIKNYNGGFSRDFQHLLSGDFDGNGKLDLVNNTQIYFNMFANNYYNNVNDNVYNMPISLVKDKAIAINTIQNNKLLTAQSILKIDENNTSTDLKTYTFEGSTLQLKNTKNIVINNLIESCEDNCTPPFEDLNGNIIIDPSSRCYNFIPSKKTNTKYLEGDFNGDSISELLIINFNIKKTWFLTNGLCKSGSEILGVNELRLIDLNPNNPNTPNTIGNFSIQSPHLSFLNEAKYFTADFNADGKTDVMAIKSDGTYKVFGFKENLLTQSITLELIGAGKISEYNLTKQILFGDYNGDSKTDIMLPNASGNGCIDCTMWHIFYSNPKFNQTEMFEKITLPIVQYWQNSGQYWKTQTHFNQYIATDINKDGKTDLMRVWLNIYQPNAFVDGDDYNSQWRVDAFINNIGKNGKFDLEFSSISHDNEDPGLPTPFVANIDNKGSGRCDGYNADIVVLRWQGRLEYLNIQKDYVKDNQLKKVTQSKGAIIDEIEYKPHELTYSFGFGSNYNSSVPINPFNYPLVQFAQMSNYFVITKLKNTSGGTTKFQDFKYAGISFDIKGIGLIGFKEVRISNWYLNTNDLKTWNVTFYDPTKRGVITTIIVQKDTVDPSNNTIYNTNLSINNFGHVQKSPVGSYPYILLKDYERKQDYVSGTSSATNYFYTDDGYFLENKSITKNYLDILPNSYLHSSIQIETNFENNTSGFGANYYIGRPKETITTNKLFVNTIVNNSADNSNTQISSSKIFYTNGNVSKTEKSSNNSVEKLVEEFDYFPNGLLKIKKISAIGTTTANAVTPLITEYTYDPTNRFIKTTKNVNDNLTTTNVSYHPVYGLVTASTNALGQTTTSVFDNWGKRTKVTDFLNKSITYTYNKTGNVYTTTETGDDGTVSIIEQDALARETKRGTKDLNGNFNFVKTEYDIQGRKYRFSEPYAATATPNQWNTTEFDHLSRPIKVTAHTGKIVTTTYDKLTVTATEPAMTKSKTINAAGLVVSATDTPGGTINYKYDANGNLLEADYDGIKTTITYDLWGRKQSLTDTSAGTYTYAYDAFSRIKLETTPKGKTEYTYDAGGRIATKKLTGLTAADATNMTTTYTYDPTNKWLTKLDVINPIDGNSRYDYGYDTATKQLNQTIENLFPVGSTTPVATFTKAISFDTFGRVENETSTAVSYGKTSTKTIKHVYKNGAEWQLLDGTSIIWQANTVNSRGQLTNAQLGNGVILNNTYDSYGYLTQQKHDKSTTNLLTLTNQFEPILGNLNQRTNSLFDTNENFEYDALDRLTKWDGSAMPLLNLPFNTTTDGFTFTGTSTQGSVSNVAGTLKVVINLPTEIDMIGTGAQRILPTGAVANDKLRIKATITNKTSVGGALVKAIMVEEDPTDPFNSLVFEIGTIENGTFNANYTISNLVPNPKLKLQFIVIGTGATNGGGLAVPKATFYVDNLVIDKIPALIQNYDDRGRITQNMLGNYSYNTTGGKPYQNNKINLTPQGKAYYNATAQNDLNIKYNMFSSPYTIAHSTKDIIDLSYNITEQRSIMYWGNTNTNKNQRPYRRYYSADGSMEITATFAASSFITPVSVEMLIFADGTAYTADVVVKNTFVGTATTPTATSGLYYLHKDYQGSILAISNAAGAIIEKRLFDPWGEIVKIQDGAGNNLAKLTFFDRGYTGHEHLQSVGLLNMNGRVYDPVLHRFLQPDSKVQEPYNTQNYNRYGYCVNNPLKYTDISGEDFGVSFAIAIGTALIFHVTDAIINHKPINLKGLATTVVTTAISGGIAYGIGSIAVGIGNFATRSTFQALAHGITQGGMTALQGGKFWSGFAAGSISSIMSSAWLGGEHIVDNGNQTMSRNFIKGIGGAGANSTVGTLFFGAISGGAGAALTGGNFWQGAATGLVVSGLNHTMHAVFDEDGGEKPKVKPKPKLNAFQKYFDYDEDGAISNLEIGAGIFDVGVTIFDIVTVPSGEAVAAHVGLKATFMVSAKLAIKNSFKGVSTNQLKKWGIKDVHKFKELALGTNKNLSKFDVVKNTTTHELMIIVKETKKIVTGTGKFVK